MEQEIAADVGSLASFELVRLGKTSITAGSLVAAILIGNQDAVRVVVAVTSVVTVLTLLVLLTTYPSLRRVMLAVARWVLASNRRLASFAAVLFLVPMALIIV